MTKHIGIVASSAEGAALCYRTICVEAPAILGEYDHPEITMNSIPFAEHVRHIRAGDWPGLATALIASTDKVARAGADFVICPDNTCHQAFDYVIRSSPLPWLHIANAVAESASQRFRRIGILGTKYLMEGSVYPDVLKRYGITTEIPDAAAREEIDTIIFGELVNGIVREQSRLYLNAVADDLKAKGCDAVVLGCTELPLLVRSEDCPLPVLDSTRLLARAALAEALGES